MAKKIIVLSHKLPIDIKRGTTFLPVSMTWKTGAKGAELPVNLTGCTAEMHIRSVQSSTVILHEMTTENGGIILGDADGTIDMYISNEDTAAFTFTKAVYSLEITFSNGYTYEKLHGDVKVFGETTRNDQ